MLVDDRPLIAAYLAFFKRRGIQISRAPRHILFRARQIVEKLERGEPYWKLRGKRLGSNRLRISIPIGRDWRLLADDLQGQVVAREIQLESIRSNNNEHFSCHPGFVCDLTAGWIDLSRQRAPAPGD